MGPAEREVCPDFAAFPLGRCPMPKISATPRNRLLTFRVTPKEFDHLRSACSLRGMRCLSDFARTAVFEYARSAAALDSALHDRLGALDQKLSRLDSAVDHIIDVLAISESSHPSGPKAKRS